MAKYIHVHGGASGQMFQDAKDRLDTEIKIAKQLAFAGKKGGLKRGTDILSIEEVQNEIHRGNTKILQEVNVDNALLSPLKGQTKALQDITFAGDNYPGGIDPQTILLDTYVGFDTVKNGVGRIVPMLISNYNYKRGTGNIRPSKPPLSKLTPFPGNNTNQLTISEKLIAGRISEYRFDLSMEQFLGTFHEVSGRIGNQGNLSLLGQSIAPEFLSMLMKLFSESVNSKFEFETYMGAVAYSVGGPVTAGGSTTPQAIGFPQYYFPNGGDGSGAVSGLPVSDLWGCDGLIVQLLANSGAVSTDPLRYDTAGKVNVVTTTPFTQANVVTQLYNIFLTLPKNLQMARDKDGKYVMKMLVSYTTYQLLQASIGASGTSFMAIYFFEEIKRMFNDRTIIPVAGMADNSALFIRGDNDITTNLLLGVSMPFWADGSSIQVIYPDETTGVSQVTLRLRTAYTPSIVYPKNCAFGTNLTLPAGMYTAPVFNPATGALFTYGS